MSKFYAAIQKLDRDTVRWEQIVKQFPDNDRYRDAIATLKQQRAELVQRIGKKNEAKKCDYQTYDRS